MSVAPPRTAAASRSACIRSEPIGRRRIPTAILLAAPAVVVLAFGVVQLLRHLSPWYDEDYTLLAVQTPLPQFFSALWHGSGLVSWLTVAPSFNAPWYLLMHGWAAIFGSSPLALRVPALLCSAAAVSVLALVARRLADDRTALTAGLLAATGPLLVQQAVEARSYGAAELATALMVLALLRREQDGARRLPLALAAGTAGLLHWFALPVVAGLAVRSMARGRAGRRDALTMVAASLPALGLVVLQMTGDGAGAPITDHVGVSLPIHALRAWGDGAWWLVAALVAAFGFALVRSPWRRLLVCWVGLPLGLVTLLELVRPMYFGRYLLFTLLGLAVGAAVGVALVPARWRNVAGTALVALSLVACVPRLQAAPLERADQVVALLEARQTAGQPVAAADGRAAIELYEAVRLEGSRLGGDLVLRPAHVQVGGTARVTWVVRSGSGAAIPSSPDDADLVTGGWRLAASFVFPGSHGDLTLQRWIR